MRVKEVINIIEVLIPYLPLLPKIKVKIFLIEIKPIINRIIMNVSKQLLPNQADEISNVKPELEAYIQAKVTRKIKALRKEIKDFN